MTLIKVRTSDNTIYNREQFIIDVIYQMQARNCVSISMSYEGPSLVSNGLFSLLDNLCDKFHFDKTAITIYTSNQVESHCEYNIVITPLQWIHPTVTEYFAAGLTMTDFYKQKDISHAVFGSFNNRPTWYRLCISNFLEKNNKCKSLVSCNSSGDARNSNSILFDDIAFHAASEFYEIVEYTKSCPKTLPIGQVTEAQKETYLGFKNTLSSLTRYYNDFFIDVIGVTYTTGDTFYMDEKETRPMLCLTPFIIYGPVGHLETMRGHGFKTFGKWWDESYDNCSGYARLAKIYKVLDKLSDTSVDKLYDMYIDMLPTLKYNYYKIIEISQLHAPRGDT